MNIISNNGFITVTLNNGEMVSASDGDNKILQELQKHAFSELRDNEPLLLSILNVGGKGEEMKEYQEKVAKKDALFMRVKNSILLTIENDSVTFPKVSGTLALPMDLVEALLTAEENTEDDTELNSLVNFWQLVAINPSSESRINLFWFLQRYGFKISSSGLFVAYRNVDIKKEGDSISQHTLIQITNEYTRIKFIQRRDPSQVFYEIEDSELIESDEENGTALSVLYQDLSTDASTVFTDHHSKTFEIKIGKPVRMDREKCDQDNEHTCSTGLHVAGKSWLSRNYFGSNGLMVLVNPADVVAVPHEDSYGKMRVCAYFPVAIIEYNECGEIIEKDVENGFEDDFVERIQYNGIINLDKIEEYSFRIPELLGGLSSKSIRSNLQYITRKTKNVDGNRENK